MWRYESRFFKENSSIHINFEGHITVGAFSGSQMRKNRKVYIWILTQTLACLAVRENKQKHISLFKSQTLCPTRNYLSGHQYIHWSMAGTRPLQWLNCAEALGSSKLLFTCQSSVICLALKGVCHAISHLISLELGELKEEKDSFLADRKKRTCQRCQPSEDCVKTEEPDGTTEGKRAGWKAGQSSLCHI